MVAHACAPALSAADWLQLVRAEYCEFPTMHLTLPQMERLWGLDHDTSQAILGVLVRTGFLRRTPDGQFVRADAAA